jgi:phosphatidylserine/phosphatidylglycerophosphate/cardiolipin synthase-like enzyme
MSGAIQENGEPLQPHGNSVGRAVIELVEAAERGVVLVSPYFEPWRALVKALVDAAERGVPTTVLVRANQPSNRNRHGKLQLLHEAGVKVRSFEWLHRKLYLSEKEVIDTSMNMVFTSFLKGREQGTRYRADVAPQSYAQRKEEARGWLKDSSPYLFETPSLETPARGLSSIDRTLLNNPRAYAPWTSAEQKKLLELVARGLPVLTIGQVLGRAPKAVWKKLRRLDPALAAQLEKEK